MNLSIQISNNEVRQNFTRVYWFGVSNLFRAVGADRVGFTWGKFGKNFDIYPAKNLPICAAVGGRPGGVKTVPAPAGLEAAAAARVDAARRLLDWEEREAALQAVRAWIFERLAEDARRAWDLERAARRA